MDDPTNATPPKPNIILITVDQLRFPMHFESLGINNADDFVERYMPNLWNYLWNDGVKFSNYYTAASDCTAARATIHTGLYGYQTYSMLTLITYPPDGIPQPSLEHDFPTIGKIMREQAQYNTTPYFGKWHLSYDVSNLDKYGYTSYTPNQDYVGYAGQGLATDDTPAWEAAHWINDHVAKSNPDPFYLTLNFVNPHDKQWFWGAMQADNFYQVYAVLTPETPPGPYIEIPPEDQPPAVYTATHISGAIRNFQDQAELNEKPRTQTLVKEVFQYQMGGIYEEDEKLKYTSVTQPPGFFYAITPVNRPSHKAIAPENYWVMALNSYIQVMGMVDDALGNFMKSLSPQVFQNSIFVFTSDHGEYGSSHGLQGKGGTVYEEGIRVPLVVRDARSNSCTAQPGLTRNQLTSSVDLLRMIVSLGYGGDGWMTGNADYNQMYSGRCDLVSILGNPNAAGRTHALHSTDEFVPDKMNFNNSPLHVIGLIEAVANGKQKLGVYTDWRKEVDSPEQASVIKPTSAEMTQRVEFYDPSQEPYELESSPTSSDAQTAFNKLFGTGSQLGLLYSELQAPLPEKYKPAQIHAYRELVRYMNEANALAAGITPSGHDSSEEVKRRVARVWAF